MSSTLPIEFRLYVSMQDQVPGMLFYISRDIDEKTVIYQAKRVDNTLIEPYINVFQSRLDDVKNSQTSLSALLWRYFGMKVKKHNKFYIKIQKNGSK